MRVLGIETSCDETGVALYDSVRGLRADALFSQVPLHRIYGGVVPELASRDHVRQLLPLIEQVLHSAQSSLQELDAIAYTNGPGLVGALLVGAMTAKTLAVACQLPSIAVHHMEGHLLAPMLETQAPCFPFLALLVSGGHTQLIAVAGIGQYKLLGQSLDDAVGEAFDKVGKMLGLPYPGGPEIARLARRGSAEQLRFPRPMCDRPGLDFSFSGLKTCTQQHLQARVDQNDAITEQDKADMACAFENAAVDTLVIKCRRALVLTGLRTLVIAGGVSANKKLRTELGAMSASLDSKLYYPRTEFCTDNGAMIAYAGCQRLLAGQSSPLDSSVRPRWSLEELPSLSYRGLI